ncbi:MAG: rRNA methyltransferase [Candidatus Marinimicrobia bacterium]|nr:rRNA methyltransferase [Candidatus Neomarinimicrobiota bacterium]
MTTSSLQLPHALQARLQHQLGPAFESFALAMSLNPPVSIRLNPDKPTDTFHSAESIPWSSQGKYLDSRPRFTGDPLFHAGAYYVQEASSMFLEHVLRMAIDLNEDHRVLDLSAAPGGKSTLLQSLLSRDSLLVANEVISSRNKVLKQNLTRWGGDNHMVTQSDPKYFNKLPGFFDLILVDAPCSGEGLMRKEPSAMNEWSENNVALCAGRQKRILADVISALANDGVLIYSTCTFSTIENEENMIWIQEEYDLEQIQIPIPESWGVVSGNAQQPGYRLYPHLLKGEGFYIAAFRKRQTDSFLQVKTKSKRSSLHDEANFNDDNQWLENSERYIFITRDQHRIAIPKCLYEDYLSLNEALRITSSGLYMGKVYHGQLKPSPELALSQYVSRGQPRLNLSVEQALDYLSHIDIGRDFNLVPGLYLVSHGGFGLGWMHVLVTGQIRNKYPAAWRIIHRNQRRPA